MGKSADPLFRLIGRVVAILVGRDVTLVPFIKYPFLLVCHCCTGPRYCAKNLSSEFNGVLLFPCTLCFKRSAVRLPAFVSRNLAIAVKQGRRHRTGSGCVDEFHVPFGVCECYPLLVPPYPPFCPSSLMAETVLSVSARAPSRSTSRGVSALAASREVLTVARDALWALPFTSPACSRLPRCCGCLNGVATVALAAGETVAAAEGLAAAVAAAAWGLRGQTDSLPAGTGPRATRNHTTRGELTGLACDL